MPPDHLFRSTNLVRVPSFCICLAKVLQVRVPDTRLALTDEISIDMKLKYLAKLYHGHKHPPVQPACRNDIATQINTLGPDSFTRILIDMVNTFLLD